MLDVHVATLPTTPRDWLDQCLASVRAAAVLAPFPVHVHVVEGVKGHIGLARQRGFAQGSQPFATYVDDDDYVAPEAFACLAPALEQSPLAVFTAQSLLQAGDLVDGGAYHMLAVYHRSLLQDFPFELYTWAVDVHLRRRAHAQPTRCIVVPERVYVYRNDGRSAGLRDAAPHERRAHT